MFAKCIMALLAGNLLSDATNTIRYYYILHRTEYIDVIARPPYAIIGFIVAILFILWILFGKTRWDNPNDSEVKK